MRRPPPARKENRALSPVRRVHDGSAMAHHPARPVTLSETLETIDREGLATIQGGQLPPGIDEAMAAGEKAAQHPKSKALLE